mgnify:CR=1 FL=1
MDTLHDVIAKLVNLQAVLKEIYDIEQCNKRLPEHIQRMRSGIEPEKNEIDACTSELNENETRRGQLALELKELQDRIQDISRRMNSVSKSRELEAVEHEFSAANDKINDCKRQDSELRSRNEFLVRHLDGLKPDYEQQLGKIEAEEARIRAEIAENQLRIEALRKERENMVVGIDIPTLTRFEKIVNSKNGIGIVQVINDSCDGCHMRIPPQMIGRVKRSQELVTCLHCSRILYL